MGVALEWGQTVARGGRNVVLCYGKFITHFIHRTAFHLQAAVDSTVACCVATHTSQVYWMTCRTTSRSLMGGSERFHIRQEEDRPWMASFLLMTSQVKNDFEDDSTSNKFFFHFKMDDIKQAYRVEESWKIVALSRLLQVPAAQLRQQQPPPSAAVSDWLQTPRVESLGPGSAAGMPSGWAAPPARIP